MLLIQESFFMNLSSELFKRRRGGSLLLLMLAAIIIFGACKPRGAAPSLSFAPVPDTQPQNSYADLVSKVSPAVITIRADRKVRSTNQFPFSDDPFFRGLFGDR